MPQVYRRCRRPHPPVRNQLASPHRTPGTPLVTSLYSVLPTEATSSPHTQQLVC
jgi:hypothetical protein